MSRGTPDYYDHIMTDPRIRKFYAGATVSWNFFSETKKEYQRRRRCSLCGELTGVRTKVAIEGMVCDSCQEKVRDKPIKEVIEHRGGIGWVHYEYTEKVRP